MGYIMRCLFSVYYHVAACLLTFLFFIGMLLLWLISLLVDSQRRWLHWYSCVWASSYYFLNPFCHVSIEGKEHLSSKGACVYIANHTSSEDILLLYRLFIPFKWVSKRSNYRIPVFGWVLWMNKYITFHRSSRAGVRHMMASCRRELKHGHAIMLFPEGTRNKGVKVGRFKEGAFVIAQQAGVPIVPIVLKGLHIPVYRKKGGITLHRNLEIQILPPISCKQLENQGAKEIATKMFHSYNDLIMSDADNCK